MLSNAQIDRLQIDRFQVQGFLILRNFSIETALKSLKNIDDRLALLVATRFARVLIPVSGMADPD